VTFSPKKQLKVKNRPGKVDSGQKTRLFLPFLDINIIFIFICCEQQRLYSQFHGECLLGAGVVKQARYFWRIRAASRSSFWHSPRQK